MNSAIDLYDIPSLQRLALYHFLKETNESIWIHSPDFYDKPDAILDKSTTIENIARKSTDHWYFYHMIALHESGKYYFSSIPMQYVDILMCKLALHSIYEFNPLYVAFDKAEELFDDIPDDMLDSYNFCMFAIKLDPMLYRLFSLRLQLDYTIVHTAVRDDGLVLAYLPERYASDINICLLAVTENHAAIRFVSSELQGNPIFREKVLRVHPKLARMLKN